MTTVEAQQTCDLARRPVPAALVWGLPIALGFAANFLRPTLGEEAWVWAGCLTWMGIGCWLNAQRCSRLHCVLSAPVLFVSAGLSAGIGLGGASAWPWALNATVCGALALVMLSFAPELARGRYAAAASPESARRWPRGQPRWAEQPHACVQPVVSKDSR